MVFKNKAETIVGADVDFTHIGRITGYLTGDVETRFNDAKQAEFYDRVKHDCHCDS